VNKTKESKTFKIIKSLFQIKVSKLLRLVSESVAVKKARSEFNKFAMMFNKIKSMFKQTAAKKLNLLDFNLK